MANGQPIRVRGFILGSYPIRGFLAWADGGREALFVDPGGWDDAIQQTLRQFGLSVTAILLTHGHWDHTGGLDEMSARLHAPVYAHIEDTRLLAQPPDVSLEGGETISLRRAALAGVASPRTYRRLGGVCGQPGGLQRGYTLRRFHRRHAESGRL